MQSALINAKSNPSKKKGLHLRKPTRGGFSGSSGFTLVELLVVLALIGILASISVVLYSNFVQKARETGVIVYLRYINKAELEYNVLNDSYTEKFEELESTGSLPKASSTKVKKVGTKRVVENYIFTLNKQGGDWSATAEPLDQSANLRWFYIDKTGETRFEKGKQADINSPKFRGK